MCNHPGPPSRLSLAAAASLVLGLMGWLILPAPLAIVTGIVGIRKTRRPEIRGRGLAVAGLVLGCVFGLVGAGIGVAAYQWYAWGMEQVRLRTPAVINAVIDGSATGGEYSSMRLDAVAQLRQKTDGWGRVSGIPSLEMTGDRVDGQPDQMRLAGEADFDRAGRKPFRVVIQAHGNEITIVDVVFE